MDTLIIINSILSPIVIGAVAAFAFKAQKEAYKQGLESAEEKYRRGIDNNQRYIQELKAELFLLSEAELRYSKDEIDSCKRRWRQEYDRSERARKNIFDTFINLEDEKG